MKTLIEWYNNETPVLITIFLYGSVITHRIILDTLIDYGGTVIIGAGQFSMELDTSTLETISEKELHYSDLIYLTVE